MERPSKYHRHVYIGKNIKNADEYGYEWYWDSAHPELEPTSTFKVNYTHYCSYCCSKAYPIQAGLRDDLFSHIDHHDRDFTTTGYTCICDGAEKEKELRNKIEEMKERHLQEEYELKNQYRKVLKHDKRGRLELKYKEDLRSLEFSEDSFRFE